MEVELRDKGNVVTEQGASDQGESVYPRVSSADDQAHVEVLQFTSRGLDVNCDINIPNTSSSPPLESADVHRREINTVKEHYSVSENGQHVENYDQALQTQNPPNFACLEEENEVSSENGIENRQSLPGETASYSLKNFDSPLINRDSADGNERTVHENRCSAENANHFDNQEEICEFEAIPPGHKHHCVFGLDKKTENEKDKDPDETIFITEGPVASENEDYGLVRANTMPSKSSNYDESLTAMEQNSFKRSSTERRKSKKGRDDELPRTVADKLSNKKKMKIMKKIALVKGDGTVEFDVSGSARYAEDLFGPPIESPQVEGYADDEMEDEEGEKRSVPPLQIAMLIVGTRGDVQPFIAIGKHLQEYGHRVRLATHTNFEEFVLTSGLEFYPLGGDPKVLAGYMVKNKGFLPSGPSEIAIQRKQLKAIIYSLLPACTEPYGQSGVKFRAEAIIANPPAYGHVHVAEALQVPIHIFFTMPWTPTSKFPHPLSRVKQPAGYRLSYQVVDSLIWLGIRGIINDFRKKKLKLRPVTYLSGIQGSVTDLPTGYIWSPQLVPKPEDWGPKIDVVGFCFLNLADGYKPPESLLQWLESGKKPIYVGFGSLPVQDPKNMTKIIVEALRKTNQRGIINKGWGGLGELEEQHDFIYTLDNCPHDWLFPRCAAVVHHGGAGTTAAGLKAACPTTIVPFFGDQPFWGERVHARGLGPPPIPVDQFSLQKLVSAIEFMLDQKVKGKALEIAEAMENEDGVAGAVKAFHKHLPKKLPRPLPKHSEHHFVDSFFSGIGRIFGCG
eukprot:TRINITY_DN2774_c0_g2_i1.p1 TRINITY_DN2774_c0_g2~~TRINITY_DN2774_c0_g2_i1.p1  ORF type:complete len:790 (+),score=201.56 TRINITY_DN2774_c0_g2_i1:390-2759(+)